MKKIILIVFLVVLAMGVGRIYYMKKDIAGRYSQNDLEKIAIESNKSLPVMIDQQTRLEKVVALQRGLEKRYTLVSATYSEELRSQLSSKLFPVLKEQSCRNSQSLNLYRSGVEETFTYMDMNGRQIASFTVGKASCS